MAAEQHAHTVMREPHLEVIRALEKALQEHQLLEKELSELVKSGKAGR